MIKTQVSIGIQNRISIQSNQFIKWRMKKVAWLSHNRLALAFPWHCYYYIDKFMLKKYKLCCCTFKHEDIYTIMPMLCMQTLIFLRLPFLANPFFSMDFIQFNFPTAIRTSKYSQHDREKEIERKRHTHY